MFYFDLIPVLEELEPAECGELLLKAMRYARDSEEPQFQSKTTGLIWKLLQGHIDRDSARYQQICMERKYTAYVRRAKKAGKDYLDFEEWLKRINNP